MKSMFLRRVGAVFGALALTAGLSAVPTAEADAAAASTSQGTCELSGGTLTWGLKESFRAYISGSIANGSWETSDGAEYEIPNFVWRNGTGDFDPETGTGSVSFTGTMHFTGHDGVLDLTLANPTVEFEGDGTAALLLDSRSNNVDGELVVDELQEWVGSVTVPETLTVEDDRLDLAEMPTTLTNSGAAAFAGFYEAGVELDPLNLVLEFDGCAAGSAAGAEGSAAGAEGSAESAESEDQTQTAAAGDQADGQATDQQVPWLPIGIGAVAILVIGFTVGLLVGGWNRRGAATPERTEAASDNQAWLNQTLDDQS